MDIQKPSSKQVVYKDLTQMYGRNLYDYFRFLKENKIS